MYNVTIKRVCNHCCSGKAISIVYYECVFVALVIQCAMRMRHIVICSLSGSRYFSILPHKRLDFRGGGGKLRNIKCVF